MHVAPRGTASRHVPILSICLLALPNATAYASEILYLTEGNRLHRIDIASLDGDERRTEVFIENASDGESGDGGAGTGRNRDINGMLCMLPDGSGRFIAGEDTGQPHPPPGWGVFDPEGRQIGKLTASYGVPLGEPFGCAFDAKGRLFTVDVGNVGFGRPRGQLILWYPPFARFPGPPGAYPETDASSEGYCKLAVDIGTASGIAIDDQGRVYVASAGRGAIYRFRPPYPSSPDAAGGCGRVDEQGSPLADAVAREVFTRGLYTFSGLAFGHQGNLYAASVFTGEIIELDSEGQLVRKILDPDGLLPPFESGNPQGIAFDTKGHLYYADLDLVWQLPSIDTGGNGKLRRIRFDDAGQPLPPEILMEGLAFPDAVSIHPGDF